MTRTLYGPGVTPIPIPARAAVEHSLFTGPGDSCTSVGGVIESLGHNLSGDASCTTFTAAGDMTNTNPLIGPFQLNWPGATPTHALLPGSPAINAGVPMLPDATLTDQRGALRRWGGPNADIGAYEVFDPNILRPTWLPFTPYAPY